MRCCDAGKRRLLRCHVCAVRAETLFRPYVSQPPQLKGPNELLPLGEVGRGLHAAGNAEGRCDSRQDADDELNDKLDGFFLHSFKG